MAVALKEKAPTDPAELKKWREDEQAKERAKRDKEKAELGTFGAVAIFSAYSDGRASAYSR
jgi:tellurite resistance protein